MRSPLRRLLVPLLTFAVASPGLASNHREAPITALDRAADLTDFYAFVSYERPGSTVAPSHVTFIACVDPLLEPANGPNFFPFDPGIAYGIHVDHDHDAEADLSFVFRFTTEQRLASVFTVQAGVGDDGAVAPSNSPAPVPPGTLIVPPRIDSFDSPGLGQRQSYTVEVQRPFMPTEMLRRDDSTPLHAVPANAGPRTIDYAALFEAGVNEVGDDIRVFAGTVDDPFFIDLGAAFDTVNFRTLGSGVPGVLTAGEDAATNNAASDTVSGYAVNAIAIEIPIEMLTSTGAIEPASSAAATIGTWATTSRPRVSLRRRRGPVLRAGRERQVQRLANPLINELLIGTGSKDRFSMDAPANDAQFADFFLDPLVARVANALYGEILEIPQVPRLDLLPLVNYAPPIAAVGTPAGPIADLLRLNTGVPATSPATASRLGLIAGDGAGYPNGRRLFDDVVDIVLRVGVGGVLTTDGSGASLNRFPNNVLGDGVNVNDAPFHDAFPYLAHAPSGRNRRHLDPGEPGGGPVE
ncbi:MAG: DUF4331 domain-containing protein [Acidobacteriota bacterium]